MHASAVKHFTSQCARATKCFNTKRTTFKLHILITSKEITQIQDIRIRSNNTKSISATNMHK